MTDKTIARTTIEADVGDWVWIVSYFATPARWTLREVRKIGHTYLYVGEGGVEDEWEGFDRRTGWSQMIRGHFVSKEAYGWEQRSELDEREGRTPHPDYSDPATAQEGTL